MKINLHNHSTFSDGRLKPSEIVQVAIDAGLTHVAITDHFASKKLQSDGVTAETIGAYEDEIRNLAALHSHQIRVLVGVEVDFSPRRTDWALLRPGAPEKSIFRRMDLVLFEYVGDPEWEGGSFEEFLDIRSQIPAPVGLAHCQFEKNFQGFMPTIVARLLGQARVFLELCPGERNAAMVLTESSLDLARVQGQLAILHRQLETLDKQLVQTPGDAYLTGLRVRIEAELDRIYGLFKKVPAYRVNSRFTRELFVHIRNHLVPLSIGTDTHDLPEEVTAIADAVRFIEEQMLQKNLITNFYWKEVAHGAGC